MNRNGTNLSVHIEATFGLPGDHATYTDPEEWIRRIDALASANNWQDRDNEIAPKAIAFLRGKAYTWFHFTLPSFDAQAHANALNGWPAFKRAFLRHFSPTADAKDMSASWYNLRQGQNEAFVDYFGRCIQTISGYIDAIPRYTADTPSITMPAVTDHVDLQTIARAEAADLPDIMDDFARSFFAACAKVTTRQRFMDLALTLIVDGLHDSRLAEKGRFAIRDDLSLAEFYKDMVNHVKSAQKPKPAPSSQPQHRPPPPQAKGARPLRVHAAGEEDDEPARSDDDAVYPVDAANAKADKNTKKKPKDKRQPPVCQFCPTEVKHWHSQCPTLERLRVRKVSAVSEAETQSENC